MSTTLDQITKLANAADALGTTVKIAFKEGGVIVIDGTGDDNAVSTEDKETETTLNIAQSDLEAILAGDLNPMGAFMGGKISVDGDMGAAMKLSSLFS